MATVQVKYLGKSKRSFGVTVKGVQYKWKPGMTHLEMPEDHAAVLVTSAPNVWSLEGNSLGVTGAEGFGALIQADIPSTGVTVAEVEANVEAFREEVKRRRKSEGTDEGG